MDPYRIKPLEGEPVQMALDGLGVPNTEAKLMEPEAAMSPALKKYIETIVMKMWDGTFAPQIVRYTKSVELSVCAQYGLEGLTFEAWCQSKSQGMPTVGVLPMPKLKGDVGYNLHSSEDLVIKPGGYAQVHTGVKVQLPEGAWGLIVARSSANRSGALIVLTGVIDNGYRGELTVMVHHVRSSAWRRFWDLVSGKDTTVRVKKGDALGQMVVLPMLTPIVQSVDVLSDSERGSNGYGSTGDSVKAI